MIQYDESVIQESARLLYAQASSIVRSWRIIGFLLGFLSGGFFAAAAKEPGAIILLCLVAAALGVGIGDAIARPKALILKLQAQQALCNVQIEKNTRQAAQLAANGFTKMSDQR